MNDDKDDELVILDGSLSKWKRVEDAEPLWSRAVRAALAVLVINLLWHDPIGPAMGGGLLPLIAFNLVPSALAVAALLGWMRVDT